MAAKASTNGRSSPNIPLSHRPSIAGFGMEGEVGSRCPAGKRRKRADRDLWAESRPPDRVYAGLAEPGETGADAFVEQLARPGDIVGVARHAHMGRGEQIVELAEQARRAALELDDRAASGTR